MIAPTGRGQENHHRSHHYLQCFVLAESTLVEATRGPHFLCKNTKALIMSAVRAQWRLSTTIPATESTRGCRSRRYSQQQDERSGQHCHATKQMVSRWGAPKGKGQPPLSQHCSCPCPPSRRPSTLSCCFFIGGISDVSEQLQSQCWPSQQESRVTHCVPH